MTVRDVERRRLFDDDRDREWFLKRLTEGVEEHGVRLYLFCLMARHVHLLAETPEANLSAFMHNVQTAYTVYYNLRHRRCGHLMQGRFGSKPVQGDEYLPKLSRYIHWNPVFGVQALVWHFALAKRPVGQIRSGTQEIGKYGRGYNRTAGQGPHRRDH